MRVRKQAKFTELRHADRHIYIHKVSQLFGKCKSNRAFSQVEFDQQCDHFIAFQDQLGGVSLEQK